MIGLTDLLVNLPSRLVTLISWRRREGMRKSDENKGLERHNCFRVRGHIKYSDKLHSLYPLNLQLGPYAAKICPATEWGPGAGGSVVLRFPIELKRLLRYLEVMTAV